MSLIKRDRERSMIWRSPIFTILFAIGMPFLLPYPIAFAQERSDANAQEQYVDPTQPSDRLLELVKVTGQPAVAPVELREPAGVLAAQDLRIRAMILRDAEHGVALIGPVGSTGKLLRIQLNPEIVASRSPVGQVLGQTILLETYSNHHVQLRSVSTGELILVQ